MEKTSWGYHLILDISGCNDNVMSGKAIDGFVKELVPAIGMRAYGEPTIVHFAEHELDAAGYTLIQLVETSAISGHFSDLNKDAYLDIFSCAQFAKEDAIAVVQRWFDPEHMNVLFLSREAKRPAQLPFRNLHPRQIKGECNGCGACCHSDAYVLSDKGIADWFEMHGYDHAYGCEQPAQVLVSKLDKDNVKIIFFDRCKYAFEEDEKTLCSIYHRRPHKCREYPSSLEQAQVIPRCSFNKK